MWDSEGHEEEALRATSEPFDLDLPYTSCGVRDAIEGVLYLFEAQDFLMLAQTQSFLRLGKREREVAKVFTRLG